jgi:hypothetical protein
MQYLQFRWLLIMWEYIDTVLMSFEKCFTRKAAFRWFVVIIIGLILRSDFAGITSIIRTLGLTPNCYEALVHFFASDAWKLSTIRQHWINVVMGSDTLFLKENGMLILIGDGVKQSKEGKKMPGVKRLHQESEDSSKAEYIFGHMFGVIGILVGSSDKLFCLPLSAKIQDGAKKMRKWLDKTYKPASHVVEIIRDASSVMSEIGSQDAILLLDAYFFTAEVLKEALKQVKNLGSKLIIVTRAKMSTIAYEKPPVQNGRGRPRKKGESVKLKNLFESKSEDFTEAKVCLYGEEKTIEYLCMDLLWGKGLYQLLRFVLVKCGEKKVILVCTSVALTAEQIIRLYGYRFKIEGTFRTLKQLLCCFGYHFWSTAMPKLKRFGKKGEKDPLSQVRTKKEKKQILRAFSATERFVMMNLIAIGLLELLALKFSNILEKSCFCWLRTSSRRIVTETTMSRYLRKEFFMQFQKRPYLGILQIIRAKMESRDDSDLPNAA